MINFDDATKENGKEHNSSWPEIPEQLWIWKNKFTF